MATNQKCNLQIAGMRRSVVLGGSTASVVNERRLSFSGMIASNNRVNHIVRSIYFLNALIILVGLDTSLKINEWVVIVPVRSKFCLMK